MSQKRYASARLDHLRRPHDHDDQWVQLPARGGFLLAFFSSCSPRVHRVEAGAWNRQTDGQTGGSQQCIKYTHAVNISVARTVCEAGSRQRHGVCLFEVSVSVCLSVCLSVRWCVSQTAGISVLQDSYSARVRACVYRQCRALQVVRPPVRLSLRGPIAANLLLQAARRHRSIAAAAAGECGQWHVVSVRR